MDELVTIEQIVTIAKDLGIAVLVLFVFYRYIIAQGKENERGDALQRSLIDLNTQAIAAFQKISATMERVSASQEQSTKAQERASALQEQALQRHIDNGRNIVATVDAVKELGKDWKNYNALVDGTVSILSGHVGEMRSSLVSILGRMDALETALNDMTENCGDKVTKDEIETIVERVIKEIDKARRDILGKFSTNPTPPTEPNSALPHVVRPPTDADGAKHAAAVDARPDEQSKDDAA